MANEERHYLAALTGIRFFAALWVVFHHATKLYGYFIPGPAWARSLALNAYLVLDTFFILSGFVMAYTYLNPRREAPLNKKTFWLARLARLYPVYLFALLMSFLVFVGISPPSIWSPFSLLGVAVYLLMLQAWLPPTLAVDQPQFPNSPSWAVSAEVFFYLVFSLLADRLKPASRKTLILTVAGLYALSTLVRSLISLAPNGGRELPLSPLWWALEFLIGVTLGRIFLLEKANPASEGARRPLAVNALTFALGAAIIVLMAFVNNFIIIITVGLTLIIPLVYFLARGEGLLARGLGHPVLVRLGEASYAIYILHAPVGMMAERIVTTKWQIVPVTSAAFFFGYLTILVGLSLLVLRWLEIPARNFIRGLFSRGPARLAGSPGRP